MRRAQTPPLAGFASSPPVQGVWKTLWCNPAAAAAPWRTHTSGRSPSAGSSTALFGVFFFFIFNRPAQVLL
jgi:hypothetical protein